jgi:hypothetical protein
MVDKTNKDTIDYLLKLTEVMEENTKAVKRETKVTIAASKKQERDETAKNLTRATELFTNGMGSIFSKQRINYELSRMSPMNAGIFRALAGSVNQQTDYQRVANGFGRSVRDIVGRNSKAMRGGTGGFTEQLTSQMSFAQAGMQQGQVSQATRNLATGMRLTGQNEQKLVVALKQTATIGGATNEGLDTLSQVLHQTGKEYGISMDRLLEGMATREDEMDNNLLGITDSLNIAITELGGEFQGRGDEIRSLVQSMIKGENRGIMALAGLDGIADQISNGNTSSEEQVVLIREAISRLGELTKNTAMINGGSRITRDISKDIYGQIGAQAAALNAMQTNTKASVDQQANFNDNFDVWGKELLSNIEYLTFEVFGSKQTQMVDILRSIDGAIKMSIAVGGATGLIKGGVILSTGGQAMRKAGLGSVARHLIGLPPLTAGAAAAGEAVKVAGTTGATIAAGKATAGAAGAAAGIGAWPVVAAAGVVIGGVLLAKYLNDNSASAKFQENLRKQMDRADSAISARRGARSADSIGISSNISRASGNTSYEIVSINTQREQNRMLQDIVKELKKGNSQMPQRQIGLGGI